MRESRGIKQLRSKSQLVLPCNHKPYMRDTILKLAIDCSMSKGHLSVPILTVMLVLH